MSSEVPQSSSLDYSQFQFSTVLADLLRGSWTDISVAEYGDSVRKHYISATEQDDIRPVFDNSFVTKLEQAKYRSDTDKFRHEYVVATVQIPATESHPPGEIYALIERVPENEPVYRRDQRPTSKAIAGNSMGGSTPLKAHLNCSVVDKITLSACPIPIDPTECDIITYDLTTGVCTPCNNSQEQTCTHRLSLLTLVSVAQIINARMNDYKLLEHQCYWYAAVVVALGRHFSKASSNAAEYNPMGTFKGILMYNKSDAVKFVKEAFNQLQLNNVALLEEIRVKEEACANDAGVQEYRKPAARSVAAAEARAASDRRAKEAAEAGQQAAEAGQQAAEAAQKASAAAQKASAAGQQAAEAAQKASAAGQQAAEAALRAAEDVARELSHKVDMLQAELSRLKEDRSA